MQSDALRTGWHPQTPFIVGTMEFTDEGGKTRYTASARHWTREAHDRHEAMGFEQGWTAVAEQLAALAEAEPKA